MILFNLAKPNFGVVPSPFNSLDSLVKNVVLKNFQENSKLFNFDDRV